ncbi:hypothetical protein MAR_022097, partial [Mya arenaria]
MKQIINSTIKYRENLKLLKRSGRQTPMICLFKESIVMLTRAMFWLLNLKHSASILCFLNYLIQGMTLLQAYANPVCHGLNDQLAERGKSPSNCWTKHAG